MIDVLFQNLHTRKRRNTSLRLTDFPSKIRTRNLSNVNIERYRYANSLNSMKQASNLGYYIRNDFVIYRRRSLNKIKIAKSMRLSYSLNPDGKTRNAHRIVVETIFENIHLKAEKIT
jgi:hypothetical protein